MGEQQKLTHILKFHNQQIVGELDSESDANKLYINFWSYFEYSRIAAAEGYAVPQLNSVTAEKMRKYDIVPELSGPTVGICVFDFPTKFQLEQVFCRNYGNRNGNCFN